MDGSLGSPVFTFKVNGSSYKLAANAVRLGTLVTYSSRRPPTLTWSIEGGPIGALPDPFIGKSIELWKDEGQAGDPSMIFRGTCEEVSPVAFSGLGWTRSYSAVGLRSLADRLVPVTSRSDGTDVMVFNRSYDDRLFDPALSGMTVGEIIRTVLEGYSSTLPSVASGLMALGIGNYTSLGGSGAFASASVLNGQVSVSVLSNDGSQGSGYDHLNPPSAALVADPNQPGVGTYDSCTVAVDTNGKVTGVTVTNSAGWSIVPEVWISPLPAATLRDLAKMSLIPPYPVTVQGDGVLQAIEGCLRQNSRNHYLHLTPDGTIRIFDLRDAESASSLVTLTLNSTAAGDPIVDVGRISLARSVEGCYGRVVVRGGPDVAAQMLSTKDGTLIRDYAYDGLTNDQAESNWKISDFTDPSLISTQTGGAATFTSGISNGSVNQLSMSFSGKGYATNQTFNLTFSGGGGTGATGSFDTDDQGSVAVWRILSGGQNYTSPPDVTAPSPVLSGGNTDTGTCTCGTTQVTVTSADNTRTWPADVWAWTLGNKHGTIFLRSTTETVNVTQLYSARILSNTPLAAGGTSVLTLDRVLPITTYNNYRIIGAAGGKSEVYRRYRPALAAASQALMTYFPFPQALNLSSGKGDVVLAMANGPTAQLIAPPPAAGQTQAIGATTMGMITDVVSGSFLLDKPSVVPFTAPSDLRAGNPPTKPDDIRIFAAVRVGSLQAIAPADTNGTANYTGSGNAIEGLTRTLTVSVPNWIDKGNQSNMDLYASDMLDSVKNAVVEGVVPLIGWYGSWIGTPGKGCQLAAAYATPWSGIPLPVVECEVAFRSDAASHYETTLRVSNRRGIVNAAIYERPIPQGSFLGGIEGIVTALPAMDLGGYRLASPLGGYQMYTGEAGTLAGPAAGLTGESVPGGLAGGPWSWLDVVSPAGAGSEFIAQATGRAIPGGGLGATAAERIAPPPPEAVEGQRLTKALEDLDLL